MKIKNHIRFEDLAGKLLFNPYANFDETAIFFGKKNFFFDKTLFFFDKKFRFCAQKRPFWKCFCTIILKYYMCNYFF
jgi:hypothetical protein